MQEHHSFLDLYPSDDLKTATHTKDHIACPPCEVSRKEVMRDASEATLSHAAEVWLSQKKLFIQPRTHRDYLQYLSVLNKFLGEAACRSIHIGNVREFVKWRKDNGVCNTRINHEVNCLAQVLTEARQWHKIKPYWKALPLPADGPGLALTPDQVQHLFKIGQRNKRWQVALWASMLGVNTTAGPGEVRHLKLQDVNLQDRTIHVREGAKNKARVRIIDLNDGALYAARRLMERAVDLGAKNPQDYLLPHRAKKRGEGFDFRKPQGHWNKAWDKMRKAAGLPHVRQYDLRHTPITWLLANPANSERIVFEIAGHVSNRMLNRYSHQRREAKRKALMGLDQLQSEVSSSQTENSQ